METTRLVRAATRGSAALCLLVMAVSLGLATHGGLTQKHWIVIACVIVLAQWPLQIAPSLLVPGSRREAMALAASGTLLGVLAPRSLGTVVSMAYGLREMEHATVPVVEEGHGRYSRLHHVELPDGRVDTVRTSERAEVGDLLEVRYDVTGTHWTIPEPTVLGLTLHTLAVLVCLGMFVLFLALSVARSTTRQAERGRIGS